MLPTRASKPARFQMLDKEPERDPGYEPFHDFDTIGSIPFHIRRILCWMKTSPSKRTVTKLLFLCSLLVSLFARSLSGLVCHPCPPCPCRMPTASWKWKTSSSLRLLALPLRVFTLALQYSVWAQTTSWGSCVDGSLLRAPRGIS